MNIAERYAQIIDEITPVVTNIDQSQFDEFCGEIISKKRIFLLGLGRSGLIARMFAMRLVQAGINACMVGDCTTPAITGDDLFIAISGSGNTSGIINIASIAKNVGARVAGISYNKDGKLFAMAERKLFLPVPTDMARPGKVGGTQVLGTLFDQSLQICTTLLIEALIARLGVDDVQMQQNHANLE